MTCSFRTNSAFVFNWGWFAKTIERLETFKKGLINARWCSYPVITFCFIMRSVISWQASELKSKRNSYNPGNARGGQIKTSQVMEMRSQMRDWERRKVFAWVRTRRRDTQTLSAGRFLQILLTLFHLPFRLSSRLLSLCLPSLAFSPFVVSSPLIPASSHQVFLHPVLAISAHLLLQTSVSLFHLPGNLAYNQTFWFFSPKQERLTLTDMGLFGKDV